jgi:hypothetical protein
MLAFIIFGLYERSKDYGAAYPVFCSGCETSSLYHLVKTRRWFKVYFIPLLPIETSTHHLVCENCERGFALKDGEVSGAKKAMSLTKEFYKGDMNQEEYIRRVQAQMSTLEYFEMEQSSEVPA